MKRLFILCIFLLTPIFVLGEEEKVYDSNYNLQYRIRGEKVYDKDYNKVYEIYDNKVYDNNYNKVYEIRRNKRR